MVFIVGYKRTPFGSFNGSLSTTACHSLAAQPVRALLTEHKPRSVDLLVMGQALPAGSGQLPTIRILAEVGLPLSTPSFSVNKVCASGMRAIMSGSDAIRLGDARVVLAGGMESMSQCPHLLPQLRRGIRYGSDGKILDGIEEDGLRDNLNAMSMGMCGERLSEAFKFTREEQDNFAKKSFEQAMSASKGQGINDGDEIVSVNGLDADEQLSKYNPEKMALLRPAFKTYGGTITAANSSPISDGAAVLLLASELAVADHSWKPLARIVAYSDAAVDDPRDFPLAVVPAVRKVLRKAGLSIEQIGLFEFNEAFASVPEAICRELGITERECVNVNGGAVAIGHPLGASGARIAGSLAILLAKKNVQYGVAAICNGGGGASAILIERCD